MFLTECLENFSIVKDDKTKQTEKFTKEYAAAYRPHVILKCHNTAIEENKKIFADILALLKSKNLHTKIAVVVWPQLSFVRRLYVECPIQKEIF